MSTSSSVLVPGTTSAPSLKAHLAVPDGPGPWPAVVVVHEVFGLTADIRRLADGFAARGYLALAPDLYTAGGARRCLKATFTALLSGAGPAVQDLLAVRAWLASHPDSTGQVGISGFCLGGGFALLLAPQGFAASAPFYGPLPKDPADALAGACPVVASYGRRDLGLRGAASALEAQLTALQVPHDVKEYAGAGHSFMSHHTAGPLTPVLGALERVAGFAHDDDAAQDAWERVDAFFRTHLV